MDKYIQQVLYKNRRIVDVHRIKEKIDSKIQINVMKQELREMQEELHHLINSFEVLVLDKISNFSDLIKENKKIGKNSDSIARNKEAITTD